MNKLCDLHTHSYYSDGTFSPAQLLDEAERKGLSAIMLCDHNSVNGLPEFAAAAKDRGVEAVAGIEITTVYGETELHILGMFLEPDHYEPIGHRMGDLLERKEKSEKALVEALRREGIDISYEAIKASTQGGYVNRAHIGVALIEKGFAASLQDAFRKYLDPARGYYVPPERLEVFETVRFLKSLGAVTVLAHPFLNLSEQQLRGFLPKAKESGLDGMETLYTKYDAATTERACAIADEFGLLHSGGSDFHGTNKPDTQMGTGWGNLRVPMQLLEKLRTRKG